MSSRHMKIVEIATRRRVAERRDQTAVVRPDDGTGAAVGGAGCHRALRGRCLGLSDWAEH